MDRPYDLIAEGLEPHEDTMDAMRAVVDAAWPVLERAGVTWLGFYVDRPGQPEHARLIHGPTCGKPACSPIGMHGACGQALTSSRTMVISDVKMLGAGYVACDPRDRAELVVPLRDARGRPFAVLDLDSHDVGSFDESDAIGMHAVLVAAGLQPADATVG
ncbi:MAG: GAF domain-containing protein [Planctomycetota bacterium]|jgi:putative methionine-R-sulfoxide reductase with GAF domain